MGDAERLRDVPRVALVVTRFIGSKGPHECGHYERGQDDNAVISKDSTKLLTNRKQVSVCSQWI